MARFTLVIRPDGKALLTCQDRLDEATAHNVSVAIGEWKAAVDAPVLVVTECDVVQVVDIEIDLESGQLVAVD